MSDARSDLDSDTTVDSDSDSDTDTDTGFSDGNDNSDGDGRPVVLAVDDEERVVQAFEIWLGEDYRVRTATDGETALELLDETVDVVLLDRHMPGLSGDEVLDRIRATGYDCQIAMVTGVDPGFDIVDMPFDQYVQKPLDADTLRELAERLLRLSGYDRRLNELYAVVQKRAILEAELPSAELERNEEYHRLLEREEALSGETDALVTAMGEEDLASLFEGFGGGTLS